MSQKSLCLLVSTSVAEIKSDLTDWLSEWQGHLLSCPGQLKMQENKPTLKFNFTIEKRWGVSIFEFFGPQHLSHWALMCICVILNADYQCIYSAQIDTLVCICTPWGIKARYFTEWCSISVTDIFDELLRYSTVKCFLLLKCTSILSDGPGVSKGNTSMILIAYWHQC